MARPLFRNWLSTEPSPRPGSTARLAWGVLLFATACSAPQAAAPPPVDKPTAALAALVAAPDPSLDAVAWLAGTWATRDLGGLTTETWGLPRAGLMLGHGQSSRDGKTLFFENLRIVRDGDEVRYVASPNGGPDTTFVHQALGAQQAEFSNPGHDFPQRIRYHRQGDVLRVRLEGQEPGGAKVVEFSLRRVGWPDTTAPYTSPPCNPASP